MKNYIVYGLGISGIATAKYLSSINAKVIVTDDNPSSLQSFIAEHLPKFPHIECLNPDQINYNSSSIIIFSPGIPLYFPRPHPILEICASKNARLMCDVSLFYHLNSSLNSIPNNFIGITGTNGKSTTTALTGYIFENLNIKSQIGGNIGLPCFNLKQNQQNYSYILEVSSYQLDLISDAKFNIACLTNITPDHIDRHGSFEKYIESKQKIFQFQNENDFSILNHDNPHCYKIFQELKNNKNHLSKIILFSSNTFLSDGISIIDKKVSINLRNQQFNFTINPIIKGKHNIENIACALAISLCYLIQNNQFNSTNIEKIIQIIEKFQGLKHRLQLVKSVNNINFINDSKATNAESTENALKSYDNIFWILGGRAKDGGIKILKPYFPKVIKTYLVGESTDDFAIFLEQNNVTFEKCQTLENAFKRSYSDALLLDLDYKNILLSPACASLDQWKNFEERGDYFCKLVNEIS